MATWPGYMLQNIKYFTAVCVKLGNSEVITWIWFLPCQLPDMYRSLIKPIALHQKYGLETDCHYGQNLMFTIRGHIYTNKCREHYYSQTLWKNALSFSMKYSFILLKSFSVLVTTCLTVWDCIYLFNWLEPEHWMQNRPAALNEEKTRLIWTIPEQMCGLTLHVLDHINLFSVVQM